MTGDGASAALQSQYQEGLRARTRVEVRESQHLVDDPNFKELQGIKGLSFASSVPADISRIRYNDRP